MKTVSFQDDVLKWLIRVVWEYNQKQRDLLRDEIEKGKTPEECKHINDEIFLCDAMLDDLKNARNGVDV